VDRAIEIVERALARYGPPVYVRHEIVHNHHVVAALRSKGAIFVDEPEQAPRGARLIFSAHGVSPAVRRAARENQLETIDATCPLVTKVHNEVTRMVREGLQVVMIRTPRSSRCRIRSVWAASPRPRSRWTTPGR
jgi:4-hydroxy-3-methylbut-2-enyl diphosphate reductase